MKRRYSLPSYALALGLTQIRTISKYMEIAQGKDDVQKIYDCIK